ncbi:MAG: hypothetical protein HYT31_04560 [Parcubacteria group bacterium]|nr:hypothetical protein [Parcubacteria group bacterium]
MKHSTNLVIISGPSGSGQDSVIQGLVDRGVPIVRPLSTVTRPMRPGEAEGKPYHFVSEQQFDELIRQNRLSEWAVVYGKKAGITKQELERIKNIRDKIGVWKMDWQGVATAKKQYPDIVAILILPPNMETLVERSRERGQQNEKDIQERFEASRAFLTHKALYDYEVINEEGKLDQAVDKVAEILKQEGFLDNNA